jgi:hypothetical protein
MHGPKFVESFSFSNMIKCVYVERERGERESALLLVQCYYRYHLCLLMYMTCSYPLGIYHAHNQGSTFVGTYGNDLIYIT